MKRTAFILLLMFTLTALRAMAMFGNVIEMSGNVCYDMGNGDYDENH